MPEITIYLDDSAERKRRRRRRWLQTAIAAATIVFVVNMTRSAPPPPPSPGKLVIRDCTTIVDDHHDQRDDPYDQPQTPPPPPPPPALRFAVTPPVLHFPGRDLPAQIVTIANASSVSIRSKGSDFRISNNCSGGAPCVAAVVFAPQGDGRREGELRVTGGSETKIVRLSGFTKKADPVITHNSTTTTTTTTLTPDPPRCAANAQPLIEPTNVHFIGSGKKTIVLSNPHQCPLRIDSIDLMNADRPNHAARGYKLEHDADCKTVLQPGQRCSFTVATTWFYTLHAAIHVKSSVVTP